MSKTTMIPAGKEIRLSQEIYYYMLMQVPQGRLTRDCDIREYLNELYGASYIDFDILATLRTLPGYSEYMARIVEKVPKHRLVSTLGYVSDGMCIEKLQAEGFKILPAKGNRGERCLTIKNICSISKRHRQSTRLFLTKFKEKVYVHFYNSARF